MTVNVEFSPKYAYIKWDSNSLSSSIGGGCIEGTSIDGRC